jgi:hypothetical protein
MRTSELVFWADFVDDHSALFFPDISLLLQLLYPDPDVNSPTFGVIGSARSGRINQFGTKLIF